MQSEKHSLLEKISNLIEELGDEEELKELVKKALESGVEPYEIVEKGLAAGLERVGKKYEQKEYFIADLIIAANLMNVAMEILEPLLEAGGKEEEKGVVVLGTVINDLHDIGKNIVKAMLKSAGFRVYDIGIDQPPKKFVEKALEVNADIVGMSALLSSTLVGIDMTIEEFKKAGVRDKFIIMVGGRPVTEEYAKKAGADAYAKDAKEAVAKAIELINKKRSGELKGVA